MKTLYPPNYRPSSKRRWRHSPPKPTSRDWPRKPISTTCGPSWRAKANLAGIAKNVDITALGRDIRELRDEMQVTSAIVLRLDHMWPDIVEQLRAGDGPAANRHCRSAAHPRRAAVTTLTPRRGELVSKAQAAPDPRQYASTASPRAFDRQRRQAARRQRQIEDPLRRHPARFRPARRPRQCGLAS